MTAKIVSWNIAEMAAPWYCLVEMDADVGLLQEAEAPPEELIESIEVDSARWRTDGWTVWCRRTAIVKLSSRAEVEWIGAKSFAKADWGELAVSRIGTLTAALVTVPGVDPIVVVSMYSFWESPHNTTGSSWIYADASAHSLVWSRTFLCLLADKEATESLLQVTLTFSTGTEKTVASIGGTVTSLCLTGWRRLGFVRGSTGAAWPAREPLAE